MLKLIFTQLIAVSIAGSLLAADPAPDKDNTGINKRDTDHKTLTPEDQSNAPEDIKITQAIRQAVVKDDSLSMAAKNIKIITVAGAVTLRGPVKSTAEKEAIGKAATTAAPSATITNKIEIEKN